jgi:hypothetical protein
MSAWYQDVGANNGCTMYTHQAYVGQLAATAYISDCSFDADFFATSMIHPPDILGWYRDETQMLSECYADTDPV